MVVGGDGGRDGGLLPWRTAASCIMHDDMLFVRLASEKERKTSFLQVLPVFNFIILLVFLLQPVVPIKLTNKVNFRCQSVTKSVSVVFS